MSVSAAVESVARPFAGCQQHSDRFTDHASAGLSEKFARQRFTRAVRVEGVGPSAVAACWPLGSVDLDNPIALLEQVGGEPGSEAAGSFNRPHAPVGVGGAFACPGEHSAVTESVSWDRDVITVGAVGIDHAQQVRAGRKELCAYAQVAGLLNTSTTRSHLPDMLRVAPLIVDVTSLDWP